MSDQELPIPAEAVEAAAKAIAERTGKTEAWMRGDGSGIAEAALRAAFDALGVKVEKSDEMTLWEPDVPAQRFRAATRDELDMTDRTGAG